MLSILPSSRPESRRPDFTLEFRAAICSCSRRRALGRSALTPRRAAGMASLKGQQLMAHVVLALLLLPVQSFSSSFTSDSRPSADACSTQAILPGPKGDHGQKGDTGEIGKPGKEGPTGPKGSKGNVGDEGAMGMIGKIGPMGGKGDKGYKGLFGLPGRKGKTGSFCDCGKYRKVVGQLDVNVARLKTSLKFVKNVIAGIRESEDKFYYIVKEERNYRDALTHCRIRGGTLAMPRDEATNLLLADYISQSGLFRVYIGINDLEKEGEFMYTDNTALKSYSSWKDSAPSGSSGEDEDCVEMLSTGKWNDVECDLTIFFVCEFMKKKK